MARLGYRAEYLAKKKLIEEFGEENVLKIAIGGAVDFLILDPKENRIKKIVEIKKTNKKRYYPKEREIEQLERVKKLGIDHNIPIELWIKFPRKDFVKRLISKQ